MQRRNLVFGWAVVCVGLATVATATNPDPVVTGNSSYKGLITSGLNMNPGQNDGPNVKIYLEDPGVTLLSNLTVDRIGPNFGDFTSGTSGTIASGTQVIDYLLHYDANGIGANNDVSGTITFSTPILGLIVFTQALDDSDAIFGAPGVTYYTGTDRGLDTDAVNQGHGDDQFSVTNGSLTFNITGWTTTNIIDEVRVIVAVPEASTTVAPAFALFVIAGVAVRRRICLIFSASR